MFRCSSCFCGACFPLPDMATSLPTGARGSCSRYRPPALRTNIPSFINCSVVLKRGWPFVHGDAWAPGEDSRKRWDVPKHTAGSLCLSELPHRSGRQRSSSRWVCGWRGQRAQSGVVTNPHPKAALRILALACHSPASHLSTLLVLISICLAVVIVVNGYNWFSY